MTQQTHDPSDVHGEQGIVHPHSDKKAIWKTFWILLVITIFELMIGITFTEPQYKPRLKVLFITLTVVKAYFIVAVFMHMKHERKLFPAIVLIPFVLFILYLLGISIFEATHIDLIRF